MNSKPFQRILLFEPRSSGHHPGWSALIAPILEKISREVLLGIDFSATALERFQDHFGDRWDDFQKIAVKDFRGRWIKGNALKTIHFLASTQAVDLVFLPNLNEIASGLWRRAFLRIRPPRTLKGKLAGIYLRPRFLSPSNRSFSAWIKRIGFFKLIQENWFHQIYLLNPWLYKEIRKQHPHLPIRWLPDPYPPDFQRDPQAARRRFGIPDDARVLLFYGGPYRRKGLDLVLEAMNTLQDPKRLLLVCAGQQPSQPSLRKLQKKLVSNGRSIVIDRFVTIEEEKLLFAAADIVLLPYRGHFETSGVFSRAMGAGKMVIASNEYLIGYFTQHHRVGLVFPSGNAVALHRIFEQIAGMSKAEVEAFQQRARRFRFLWSPEQFERKLLNGLL